MCVRNNPEMAATKMFDLARNQSKGLKLQPLTLQNCVSLAPNFLCDQRPISPGLSSATPVLDSPGIESP